MTGRILDYEIVSRLGEGAFAEVFMVRRGRRRFALKVMKQGLVSIDATAVIQALRYECWVLKDLNHPNIVRVFDYGQNEEGRFYIVEEYLEGVSLSEFSRTHAFTDCEPVFRGLLSALQLIHAWKIVHADIKGQNILVVKSPGGYVGKLCDFGLAQNLAVDRSAGSQGLTGTPGNLAPEVIIGQSPTPVSDLYSFGVALYEALSGRNPFVRENLQATLAAQLGHIPEPIGLLRDDVPPVWQDVIDKLLIKDPRSRLHPADAVLNRVKAQRKFTLHPTPFVGRERELRCLAEIEQSLAEGNKLAVVVQGEEGVGVTRFLQQVFFSFLSKHPQQRDKISLGLPEPEVKSLVLLLKKPPAPQGYRVYDITLEPFSLTETRTWLCQIFALLEIPEDFITRVHQLTRGKPRVVWDILQRLAERDMLADVTGHVTKASLSLIDWGKILPPSANDSYLYSNFDYVVTDLRGRLRRRENILKHPLWQTAQAIIVGIPDLSERLKSKATLLLLKGACHIDLMQLMEAREDLRTALEIMSTTGGDVGEKIRTQNYLAYVLARQGQRDDAIALYEKSGREMAESLDEGQRLQITNFNPGLVYYESGKLAEAIDHFASQLASAEQRHELAMQLHCHYYLALSLIGLDDHAKAERHLKHVQALARQIQDPSYILRANNSMANILRLKQRTTDAVQAYSDSLELALALSDMLAAAVAIQNRSLLKSESGDADQAVSDLKQCLEFLRLLKTHYSFDRHVQCRAEIQLCRIYGELKKYEEARSHIEQAWHLCEQDPDLGDMSFWIFEGWCRLDLQTGSMEKFKQRVSLLKYYARHAEEKKALQDFLGQAGVKERLEGREADKPLRTDPVQSTLLETMLQVTQDLVGEMDLDTLLTRILSHAIDFSRSEFGVIMIINAQGLLEVRHSLNANLTEELSGVSRSVAQTALNTGDVVTVIDAAEDGRFNANTSVMALHLKSIMGVPILFRNKVLGVLYLSHRYQRGLYTNESISLMRSFASQAGLALKNHELLQIYRETQAALKGELERTQKDLLLSEEQSKSGEYTVKVMINDQEFITASSLMRERLDQARRIAKTMIPVVIHGESGSGKEVLARYIHHYSGRREHPFIAINCGAIPEQLVESELFGHTRGSFTGAAADRAGLIETAEGGTLFLDEITDLPLTTQVKLLRVLQEREITRVGESLTRPIDVRVIAASHRDLREAVAKKIFREDLYYRLAGMEVIVPSLRERREDIPLLAQHFLKTGTSHRDRVCPEGITAALLKIFCDYPWPGNIRELKNVVEVSAALSHKKKLSEEDLPEFIKQRFGSLAPSRRNKAVVPQGMTGWYVPGMTWKEYEVLIYASAFFKLDFDVPRVAASLAVGVATVYRKLKQHRIAEGREIWRSKVVPYRETEKFAAIRKFIFREVLKQHQGRPYLAARELAVASVTVYRYGALQGT